MLAGVQRRIAAAQARDHAGRRPDCSRCDGVCRVKDHRTHAVPTLFGQITVRLPRFRCAACGGIEAGIDWPSHGRPTPELNRLQAHLRALLTRGTAADVLERMFPADAGKHPETLRRHTLEVGEALRACVAARPETAAPAIAVTLAQPSSAAARRASGTWRCGPAMPEQRRGAGGSPALPPTLHIGLVHPPGAIAQPQMKPDPLLQFGGIRLDPAANGRVVHCDPAIQQHQFEVSIADGEHQIAARRPQDHPGGELPSLEHSTLNRRCPMFHLIRPGYTAFQAAPKVCSRTPLSKRTQFRHHETCSDRPRFRI